MTSCLSGLNEMAREVVVKGDVKESLRSACHSSGLLEMSREVVVKDVVKG